MADVSVLSSVLEGIEAARISAAAKRRLGAFAVAESLRQRGPLPAAVGVLTDVEAAKRRILAAAGQDGGNLGTAVRWLKDAGAPELSRRLRVASRGRNAMAHFDTELLQHIQRFLDQRGDIGGRGTLEAAVVEAVVPGPTPSKEARPLVEPDAEEAPCSTTPGGAQMEAELAVLAIQPTVPAGIGISGGGSSASGPAPDESTGNAPLVTVGPGGQCSACGTSHLIHWQGGQLACGECSNRALGAQWGDHSGWSSSWSSGGWYGSSTGRGRRRG